MLRSSLLEIGFLFEFSCNLSFIVSATVGSLGIIVDIYMTQLLHPFVQHYGRVCTLSVVVFFMRAKHLLDVFVATLMLRHDDASLHK